MSTRLTVPNTAISAEAKSKETNLIMKMRVVSCMDSSMQISTPPITSSGCMKIILKSPNGLQEKRSSSFMKKDLNVITRPSAALLHH